MRWTQLTPWIVATVILYSYVQDSFGMRWAAIAGCVSVISLVYVSSLSAGISAIASELSSLRRMAEKSQRQREEG